MGRAPQLAVRAGALDEHPGAHQHQAASYQLRVTGKTSSTALPCVGTAGAVSGYSGWVRQQGWDRGAPGPSRTAEAEAGCNETGRLNVPAEPDPQPMTASKCPKGHILFSE